MLNVDNLLAVMPEHQEKIQRMQLLMDQERLPTITVVGKYNHGKSSLLNALVGESHFAVADKRQTRSLERAVADGVCWLDAPGLDADIQSEDDAHAHQAAWLEGDVRLFVHAAREGELDAAEQNLLLRLLQDEKDSQRAVIFVLSQSDQVASDETLTGIINNIQAQAPEVQPIEVSAMRYQRGVEREQPLFIEKSGVPELQERLSKAIAQVPAKRQAEKEYLFNFLTAELDELISAQENTVQTLKDRVAHAEHAFAEELQQVLAQAAVDLHDIMQEPEVDEALDPGSIDDVYKVTAGKIERSKIQNAYSRVCIHIRGVLTRHGVVALPKQQQTGAKGLDTVMVVVMGVSVKYRADLRRMFGEAAGRERLYHDFKKYFDQSQDHLDRLQAIEQAQQVLETRLMAREELQQWHKLAA